MKTNTDESIKLIDLKSSFNKVIKHINDTIDMTSIKISLTNDVTNLLFPVCGKHCFNCVGYNKNKSIKPTDSNYIIAQSWDNNGLENKRSSVEVLIDWFTTKENCFTYFGGLDAEGCTNGNRKETYHYLIRNLIRNENGMFKYRITCI